jgi:hypothetical protein
VCLGCGARMEYATCDDMVVEPQNYLTMIFVGFPSRPGSVVLKGIRGCMWSHREGCIYVSFRNVKNSLNMGKGLHQLAISLPYIFNFHFLICYRVL